MPVNGMNAEQLHKWVVKNQTFKGYGLPKEMANTLVKHQYLADLFEAIVITGFWNKVYEKLNAKIEEARNEQREKADKTK